jgi:hypothetical protein
MSRVNVDLILRVGIFGTFIGHGLIALQVNPSWIPYLTAVGFSPRVAQEIMPFIGALDIVLAIWVLFKPNKYVLIWMVIWGFATALMRPFSGESILGFVERAANWATPLALLLLRYIHTKKGPQIID